MPTGVAGKDEQEKPIPPVFVPGMLNCFYLDVYVVGHFEREFILGKESLLGKVDAV